MPKKILPYFVTGNVVKGYGRGHKNLGIPTANYGPEVVNNLPPDFDTGVYYGWASVDNGEVHKMVMSVGWNPFFNNEQKSVETYLMHKFENDFYGATLRACVLGYLRPQNNYGSLDELICAIHNDIKSADSALDDDEFQIFKKHAFFTQPNDNI